MINKLSWIARRTKRRLNIEDNFLLQSMGIAIVRKRKTIKWVILLVLIFDPSLSRLLDRNKSLNYSNFIFIGRQGFKIDRAWRCLWWIQNERNFDPLQKRVINIHWRQTGLKSGGAEFETYLVKFETYLVNSRLMQ